MAGGVTPPPRNPPRARPLVLGPRYIYLFLTKLCSYPAVVGDVLVATLLCDSLAQAEDAPTLRFSMSPNEVRAKSGALMTVEFNFSSEEYSGRGDDDKLAHIYVHQSSKLRSRSVFEIHRF